MRISAGPFCDARQLSTIDALIRADPATINLRFGRACCLEDLGLTAEAVRAYLDVLKRQPAHFGALTNLGSLLFERGHLSAARPYFQAAADLHPADPVALVNLARLDAESGEFDAAVARYASALAVRPESLHAHLGISKLYAQRGDFQRAQACLDRAYAKPWIWHYPYRGTSPPLRALVLASAAGGDIVCNLFFDDEIVAKSVLLADSVRGEVRLPPHHVLFNAIGDADRCADSLERARAIHGASQAAIVNDPLAVARTGRVEGMRRLRHVDGVRAPRTERIAREDATPAVLGALGFTFPLLLRSPGHHAGMHLALIESAAELSGAVAALPGSELIVIEHLDARGADGAVRKYRVICVDGRLYPLHLAIASHWKVHYFNADMAARPDHRAEEAAYLDDMRSVVGERGMRALEAIFATLGLDYAGADFGIDAAGNVLLFEANAAMAVYLPDSGRIWDYRRAAVNRVIDAVRTMLIARANTAGYGVGGG
jgi:tetratricopeptide (TPR) repeat protein